jgi:hypothetical protein
MKFNKLLRPSPGLVIAVMALFVSLGGTALAVNSINGNQLKNRSVAGIKLEKHAITGTEVNLSKLGKVPTAHQADQATNATNANTANTAATANALSPTATVSGSQVTGTVANATNATNATDATNATNATNPVGHAFTQMNGSTSSATTDDNILSDFGGLTLGLRCNGGKVDIDATSATSGAFYGMSGVANNNATNFVDSSNLSSTAVTDQDANPAQLTFAYKVASGFTIDVVSGTLTVLPGATCFAFGNAEASAHTI